MYPSVPLLHHADSTEPALPVTDTTSFAHILMCLKETFVCSVNGTVRTIGITQSTAYTLISIPFRGHLLFITRFEGFSLTFFEEGTVYHLLDKFSGRFQSDLLSL
jgi:hypothetical protein